jgi:hypothetical protein
MSTPPSSCLASLSRVLWQLVVALVLAIGMAPSSGSATRTANDSSVEVQGAEDSEISRRNSLDAQSPRRIRTGTPRSKDLERPNPPRRLAPNHVEIPRPSWQRPRRTAPPPEDDDADALT